jgi:small multidrug resistance pump
MLYYVFLALAILLECTGTYFLKVSDGFSHLWPSVASLCFYATSFFCFSKALQGILLSVAYASWGALGIVVATAISVFMFHEPMNATVMIGIIICIIGVVVANLGSLS